MNIGDTIRAVIEHGESELARQQCNTELYFKIIKIYPDEADSIKDIFLCEHIPAGYKRCFYRMDLERWNYDKQ